MTEASPPRPGGTDRMTVRCTPSRGWAAALMVVVGLVGSGVTIVGVLGLLGLDDGGPAGSVVGILLVLLLVFGVGGGLAAVPSRLEVTAATVTYRRPFLLASERRWSLAVPDLAAIHLDRYGSDGSAHDRTIATFTAVRGDRQVVATRRGHPIDLDRVSALLRSGPGARVRLTESRHPLTDAPDH